MTRKKGTLIFHVRIQHILQGVEYSFIKNYPNIHKTYKNILAKVMQPMRAQLLPIQGVKKLRMRPKTHMRRS
jgi:hypothetical protein